MPLSAILTEAPPAVQRDGVNLTAPEPDDSALFEEHLNAAAAHAVEESKPCSLLLLEPSGDCTLLIDLLVGVALVEAGEGAAAFAVGGNQYALLVPGTPLATALSLARLLELRLAFVSEGRGRVWIGAAELDAETASADELFARAHLAMLEAREFAAPTAVAYGRPLRSAPPLTEAGTARLLADIIGFDRALDAAATTRPAEAACRC